MGRMVSLFDGYDMRSREEEKKTVWKVRGSVIQEATLSKS